MCFFYNYTYKIHDEKNWKRNADDAQKPVCMQEKGVTKENV